MTSLAQIFFLVTSLAALGNVSNPFSPSLITLRGEVMLTQPGVWMSQLASDDEAAQLLLHVAIFMALLDEKSTGCIALHDGLDWI